MSDNPSEVLCDVPSYPKREQTLKAVQDKFPGHIAWASDRGNFSGCRFITFVDGGVLGLESEDEGILVAQAKEAGLTADSAAEEFANLYFSKRANLLVVNSEASDGGGISMWVTTQLDDDDLEEFQEANRMTQIHMREWREKRAERKLEEAKAVMEERRLIEVGRNSETYNLVGRMRELEEENAALRKAAANAV